MKDRIRQGIQVPNRKGWGSKLLSVAVILSILFSGYSLYKVVTLKPGEKATVVPGVTVEKPEKRFDTAFYDGSGNLIIRYSDGSELNAGKFDEEQSTDKPTPAPTLDSFRPLVQRAVAEICSNDACKADAPSLPVVVTAVMRICNEEPARCKGEDGADGRSVTDEQLAAAVATGISNYCATHNNCKGDTGETGATGQPGMDGRTQFDACVIRWDATLPGVTRYYHAWRYTDEPNSAYRNIHRIPSNEATNDPNLTCIDLRT